MSFYKCLEKKFLSLIEYESQNVKICVYICVKMILSLESTQNKMFNISTVIFCIKTYQFAYKTNILY